MRRRLLYSVLAVACVQSSAHAAWRLDYDLELGLRHSDNINFSESDPIRDNVLIPRITFSLSESGSTIQADIAGNVEYLNYLGGTYGNELRGQLDASLNWVISPERFAWVFSDYLGMEPINRRDPATPNNLQRVNIFSTGPTLRMSLGPTVNGEAQVRYTDTYAETSRTFDSSRFSGLFRTEWRMSSTRLLGGNIEAQDVDFDDDLLSRDYKRYSIYADYTKTYADVVLNVMAGHTRIDFRDGQETSGPLLRGSVDWEITPNHRAIAIYTRGYSDAASYLVRDAGPMFDNRLIGGVGIGGVAVSPDVYKERRIEAAYRYGGTRFFAGVSAGAAEYDYVSVSTTFAQDRKERDAFADVSFRLSELTSIGASFGIIDTDYTVIPENEVIRMIGGYFEQRLSRHWQWRLDLTRNDRDTNGTLPTYVENAVYARVIYSRE